ncbi:MAG: hypothetical protein ACI4N6_05060 [Eubacteriales bacterium]
MSTITDNLPYAYGEPIDGNRDKGIYKYGDMYLIQYNEALKAPRTFDNVFNLLIGKIDDSAYYPIIDVMYSGFLMINDTAVSCMYKVFKHGSVCVSTEHSVPEGATLQISLSSDFPGA